jgi:hypothetical protein
VGISLNLIKLGEFNENQLNSQVSCKFGAFSPPWLKTLIFIRDSWWFWRPLAPQKAGNHIFPAFSCKNGEITKFLYFTIKTRISVVSRILGSREPPEPPRIP